MSRSIWAVNLNHEIRPVRLVSEHEVQDRLEWVWRSRDRGVCERLAAAFAPRRLRDALAALRLACAERGSTPGRWGRISWVCAETALTCEYAGEWRPDRYTIRCCLLLTVYSGPPNSLRLRLRTPARRSRPRMVCQTGRRCDRLTDSARLQKLRISPPQLASPLAPKCTTQWIGAHNFWTS
jgi:hypothetical protein